MPRVPPPRRSSARGPYRLVVSGVRLTPIERGKVGRPYDYNLGLLELECGHSVLRHMVPPREKARCGLCLELAERERVRWGIR